MTRTKTFAIIGLGQFGKCMAESLAKRNFDMVIIDKDDNKVAWAKNLTSHVVKADALNFEIYTELFPKGMDCAVIDLGERMEPSILVTNHLHKMEVPRIMVQALSPEHSEILRIVGATKVIFPEQEAAERLVGLLAGRGALDYFPVGEDFSAVERQVPEKWVGHALQELQIRKNFRVNVVAIRKPSLEEHPDRWQLPEIDRLFETDDLVLLAGTTKALQALGD